MRDRVLTWEVPGAVAGDAAFAALFSGARDAFWLDTGGVAGGVSYLGQAAWSITAEEIREAGYDVFSWLQAERGRWDVDTSDTPAGFTLGLVGWFGYELYAETLGIDARYARRYPDAAFMMIDRALSIDHSTGRAQLIARGRAWDGELAAWRDATLATLAELDSQVGELPELEPRELDVRWRYPDAEYLAMIRSCKHSIADGDAYVLCLTTEATVAGRFDPWDVYRRLRRTSPSHHGAFLKTGDLALLSASPEQFLEVTREGRVTTKPIKGTRPRGRTAEEDVALAEELRTDAKERAENVMIVDLMRNDLHRVCEIGTVEVVKLLDVETYPPVHQLVSTVTGRLAPGKDCVDAIRSCFPAGSMTGAPKHSSVTILRDLEQRSRGVYSGAFGYLGFDGAVDLAMTIRSIVIDGDGATIGTGGGITALSDPEQELEETRIKAAALLRSLAVSAPAGEPSLAP